MFMKFVTGENREETSELSKKHFQQPCRAGRTVW